MEHMLNQTECAAPSQEPSLEVVRNNAHSTRDTINDIDGVLQMMEDFLNGATPRSETDSPGKNEPAGMLPQLCAMGATNHDRLCDLHRRLTRLASGLGVAL